MTPYLIPGRRADDPVTPSKEKQEAKDKKATDQADHPPRPISLKNTKQPPWLAWWWPPP